MYILSNTTNASNFVAGVDKTFMLILGISFIFLIGLTFVMLYFIYKYNSKKNPVATQIKGNTSLEIIWTVVPTILVLVMFYYGWEGWIKKHKAPKDAFNIQVTARMWNFSFRYENGKTSDTLFVPLNKPVKLSLVSLDVIHGLFIPSFRIKEDIVPGRVKTSWFIPEHVGQYELFCSSYCGLNHSYMFAWVKTLPQDKFNAWYADTTAHVETAAANVSPAAEGQKIMKTVGCFACHTTDGSKLVGPSLKGVYGSKQEVTTNGSDREIVADDEYIHRSIYDPNADIVKGFSKGLMQPYKDQLSDDQVKKIIDYLKTLK